MHSILAHKALRRFGGSRAAPVANVACTRSPSRMLAIAVCIAACAYSFVATTFASDARAAPANNVAADAATLKAAANGWDGMSLRMRSAVGQVDWFQDLRSRNKEKYQDFYVSEKVQFWITEREGKVIVDVYDRSNKWEHRYVGCYNAEYAFVAAQYEKGGAYILTEYGRDSAILDRLRGYVLGYVPGLKSSHDLHYESRTLSQIVGSPDFSLLSSADVRVGGRSLKQIAFSFFRTEKGGPDSRSVRRCELLVDPSANWRIVKSVFHDGIWDTTAETSYADLPYDVARLTRYEERGRTSDGSENVVLANYTALSFQPTRPAEFRLPAIGMPEIPSPGRRRWLMLLIVGGNLLLIGLVLAVLHRRRTRLSRG